MYFQTKCVLPHNTQKVEGREAACGGNCISEFKM